METRRDLAKRTSMVDPTYRSGLISTILVPVDASDHALELAKYSATLAEKFGARIKFLHVIDSRGLVGYWDKGEFVSGHLHPEDKLLAEEMKEKAEETMRKIADALCDHHVEFETRIEYGKPVKRILEIAHRDGCDLIIMGAPHLLSLRRILFGDIISKVIRSSKCPVLVVP